MKQHQLAPAYCISCGCDDHHSCDTDYGKCTWVLVDRELGVGVCSGCESAVEAWHQGVRQRSAASFVGAHHH
ncbi:MAG: hypothetical protein V7731_09535 [Amphritea sp.]